MYNEFKILILNKCCNVTTVMSNIRKTKKKST